MRTIVEHSSKNIVVMDVFSKLIQERIIFIDGPIDDDLTNGVIAQMIYLDSIDTKLPINIYINTPGGGVYNGLAIYDISKIIKAPIRTVCIGMAASMGAILMLMGEERCATKHSRVMIHQPMGGAYGQATEIKIVTKEIEKIEKELYQIISEKTKKTFAEVAADCDRDYWMTSEESLKYGIINKIL